MFPEPGPAGSRSGNSQSHRLRSGNPIASGFHLSSGGARDAAIPLGRVTLHSQASQEDRDGFVDGHSGLVIGGTYVRSGRVRKYEGTGKLLHRVNRSHGDIHTVAPKPEDCVKCGRARTLKTKLIPSRNRWVILRECVPCKSEYVSPSRAAEKERARLYGRKNKPTEDLAPKTLTNKKWEQRHPEKRRAHKVVEVALRNGTLVRRSCEICGAEKTHAHHEDYSQPLSVQWLCHAHHVEVHRSKPAGRK